MGNTALELGVNLETVNCGGCGGVYALAANYKRQMRRDGGSWNCPYCGIGWGYSGSEMDKLKRKLEAERKRREWAEKGRDRARERADHEARRAAGYKGAMTKAKKRVGKGVCPCCNRSFEDLRRHMETKHPDYAESEPEPVEAPGASPCGAETADGTPCHRKTYGTRCWQHDAE